MIDRVDLNEQDVDELCAYLYAAPSADRQVLSRCATNLKTLGFKCTPHTKDGEPALEVRGIGSKDALLDALAKCGAIQGEPYHVSAEEEEKSWKEKFEKRKLQASGGLYLLGDVSYFMSGWKGSKWEEKAAGLLYFGGSAVIGGFGKTNMDRQLDDISNRLAKHLHKEAIKLPKECALSQIRDDKKAAGLVGGSLDFLHKYPSETLNALYILAGVMVAKSGLRNKQGIDKMWDVAAGSITSAAAAGTLLVKEKQRDSDEPKRGGLAGVWDWVQEKPNRIAGYGYIVSTLMHGMSAYREYKHNPAQRSYIYKGIFVAINIVAEVLMAESHKSGHGLDNVDSQGSMLARAAECIAAQPEHMREPLVHHIAGFFASQPDLHGTAAEYTELLRVKVQEYAKNPWADAAVVESAKKPDVMPAHIASWQQKISQAAPSSQLTV